MKKNLTALIFKMSPTYLNYQLYQDYPYYIRQGHF